MSASSANNEKIEPILYLLAAMMIFFTAVLIGVEWGFHDDAQVFQVVATILSGIAGAFTIRIKPANQSALQAPGSTSTTMSSTDTPPEPKTVS
jgi:uncharacterized membrane-anchored protein